MLQWTESGGATEVILTSGDADEFEMLVDLLEDLCGTATPRYTAEVIQWWFVNRDKPLVMACGDLWEFRAE